MRDQEFINRASELTTRLNKVHDPNNQMLSQELDGLVELDKLERDFVKATDVN